jgi:hypothetical protein
MLFLDIGDGVDPETWEHHRRGSDYSRWLRDKVKDPDLADEIAAIERSPHPTDEARALVREAVSRRYTAPG